MPWLPMTPCDECGSTDIRLVPDDDPSVGYRGEVWVCGNGHNVEVWVRDEEQK